MKKLLFIVAAAIVLSLSFQPQTANAQTGVYVPNLVNFDTAMEGLMSRYHVPGGELAITYYGHLIYNRGFGYADTIAHTQVEPSSVFRIASVTKPITAITIMHLFQQHRIHLGDTVFGTRGILNDTMYSHILDPRVYNITVRELLVHSGGWNDNISLDPMFDSYPISVAMGVTPPAGPPSIIEFVLRNWNLDFTPGTQYAYSNFGYCILGQIIQKITGQQYETYVHDTILVPLGITDMHLGYNLLSNQLPMEVHYYDYPGAGLVNSVYDNTTQVPYPYAGFNIEAMNSHGRWVASASDLVKIVCAVDNFTTSPQILTSATLDTMYKPSTTNTGVSIGWNVNTSNNYWHNGSIPGTTTEMARLSNHINWSIVLNTRTSNINDIDAAVDQLVSSVTPTITSWDTVNLSNNVHLSIASQANITCFGGTGSATANAAIGGTTPYTYSWSPSGGSGITATGLSAGTYTITVKDANGFFDMKGVTITQPNALSVNAIIPSNSTCNGNLNGQAQSAPSGGTSPYTYLWSNGATISAISGCSAGNYTITINDANNCTASTSVSISQPAAALSISMASSANVSCNGGTTGSATALTATGGTPIALISTFAGKHSAGYSGDGGQASAAEINGPVGITSDQYGNIFIADYNNNLIRRVDHSSGIITTVAGNSARVAGYSGDGGSATAAELNQPFGVAVDLTGNLYIADLANNVIRKVSTSGIISTVAGNHTAGYYGNGGAATSAELHAPEDVGVDASGNIYIADNNNSVIRKVNASTGIIYTIAGNDTYGYSGDGYDAVTAALHGAFCVKTDALGNIYIADYSNQVIRKVNYLTGVISTVAGNQAKGAGYSGDGGPATSAELNYPSGIAIDASGNIYISDHSNQVVREVNNSTGIITTVAGIGTNGYSGNGGAATSAELWGTEGLALDPSGKLYISEYSNSTVRLVTSTGSTLYKYSWTPGGGTNLTASNLSAGTYTLTATDYHNCTASFSVSITQPAAALATSAGVISNVSVHGGNNGSATSSPSGGTSPYTYSWNSSPSQTSQTATGLIAGNYTVYITDAHGCITQAPVSITQPCGAYASVNTYNNVTCSGANNGSITVSLFSGTSPYTYLWSPSGGTNSTASNLAPNIYTVTITDANGCGGTTSQTISQPSAMGETIASQTNVTCSGGAGSATANIPTGGTPFQMITTIAGSGADGYNGDGISATSAALASPYNISEDASGNIFIADNYFNLIREVNKTSGIITTVAGVNSPVTHTGSYNGDNIAATTATLSGPTSVLVDDSDNIYISDHGNNIVRKVYHSTGKIITYAGNDAFGAGFSGDGGSATSAELNSPYGLAFDASYNLYITDYSNSRIRKVNKSTGIITTIAGSGAGGVSGNNGQATSAGIGAPIGIAIDGYGNIYVVDNYSNGEVRKINTSGIISQFAGNLAQGYTGDGGQASWAELSSPYGVSADASGNVYISDNANDVIRKVNTSGIISTFAGNHAFGAGYSGNGGAATSAELSSFANVASDGSGNLFISDINNSVIRKVSSTGSTLYNYSWAPTGGTNITGTGLSIGTYTVTASDLNGCTGTASVNIIQGIFTAGASAVTNVFCNGSSTGIAQASPTNGTSPYTYTWSNGATTSSISGLSAGTYTLSVSDVNSCSATASLTITQPATAFLCSANVTSNVSIHGGNNGSATTNPSGGNSPYTYSWNTFPVQITQSASGLSAGSYTVIVADANGCSLSFAVTITQPPSGPTGTWTQVTTNCPDLTEGGLVLLTDGTVISHNTTGGGYGTGWDRLTPNSSGSYINGTWSTIPSMTYDRLYFATQVLQNGNVYVAGGEYGAGGKHGEIYNPLTNSWSNCGPFVDTSWNIYDGNSENLANGNILQGFQISPGSEGNNFYNPTSNAYSAAPNSLLNHDEAQWLKLPDGSILFIGAGTKQSNRYIPGSNTWVADANLPDSIYDKYGTESGNAFMLPNGKAIFFGGTPHTAIYTPSGNSSPGSWVAGPDFPTIDGIEMGQPDAAGAMMNNGKILLSIEPIGTSNSNEYIPPTYFVEYDYTTNSFAQVHSTFPGFGGDSVPTDCFKFCMIDLPDGNVLVSIQQTSYSNKYFVYTPGSAAIPQGKPTISAVTETSCSTYRITGKLFNGISEGAAYGDDWQMETNYPIVRLTNGSNVYYGRTSYWNRIGAVQTDSLADTAQFTLPTSLPAGTYSLVVVANGFPSNPILFTPFSITASVTSNISCSGGNSGSLVAAISGGSSPYTYLWTGGTTNSTLTGLSAGSYTLTVTDNTGCTATTSGNITNIALQVVVNNSTNVTCFGSNNGTANLQALGGTSPYTYSWSPGGSTNLSNTGLTGGTYTVTLTDKNGCTATTSVIITYPLTNFSVTIASQSNVPCGGGSGSATANNASGGTPLQIISTIAGVPGSNGYNGDNIAATSALLTFPYGVSVDASGNVFIADNYYNLIREINKTSGKITTVAGVVSPLTHTGSYNGDNIAATTATLSSPTSVLVDDSDNIYITDHGNNIIRKVYHSTGKIITYAGNNAFGAGFSGDGGSATSAELNSPYGLAFDASYNLYITDFGNNRVRKVNHSTGIITTIAGNGVSGVSGNNGQATSADVGVPLGIAVDGYGNIYVVDNYSNGEVRKINTSGIISQFAGNLAQGYTGDGGQASSAELSSPYGVSADASGNVYISDNANDVIRKVNTSGIISTFAGNHAFGAGYSGNGGPATSAELSSFTNVASDMSGNLFIADINNSLIREVTSAGSTLYNYAWTPSGGTNLTATGLGIGTYTITATDLNGCTASTSVNIIQGTFAANAAITANVLCNGNNTGSAQSVPSLGTSPFTYSWSNGATTSSITGLSAGTYTLTVVDINSCSATASVTITQPSAPVSITIASNTSINCNGGTTSITANPASGGASPYTYSWSPGGGTNLTTSSLTSNTYTITAKDANGCTGTASFNLTQPTILLSQVTSTFSYTGSLQNFTVPAGVTSISITSVGGAGGSKVGAGGLAASLSGIIPVTSGHVLNILVGGAGNPGGTTPQTAGGGGGTFVWDNTTTTLLVASGGGGGTGWHSGSGSNGGNGQTINTSAATLEAATASAGGSGAGGTGGGVSSGGAAGSSSDTYSGSGGAGWGESGNPWTGSTGPYGSGNYPLAATNPGAGGPGTSWGGTGGYGGGSGGGGYAGGGGGGYNGGGGGNGNSPETGGGGGGSYFNGTTATTTTTGTAGSNGSVVIVYSSNPLVVNQNVNCNGGSNGSITAPSITGGLSPYTYSWSPGGSTNSTISNLSAGIYILTITDANGCTAITSASITQPTALTDGTPTRNSNVSCNGGNNGSATAATPSGGTTPYTYQWNSGTTSTNVTNSTLSANTYSVIVTDANGCTATSTGAINITQPNALLANASVLTNVNCNGNSIGSAQSAPSGGISPYTYAWQGGATTSSISGKSAGTYTLTITDANNCSTTASISITQPNTLLANASVSTNVNCKGNSTGNAQSAPSGGTSPYTYLWQGGATTSSISSKSAGTYTLTVHDANNCSSTASVSITQPVNALAANASVVSNVTTNGGNNGSATSNPSGGTSPYTYSWNSSPVQTTQTATGLTAGSYTVFVTDANGCSSTGSVVITQPGCNVNITPAVSNVTCNGNNNGIASASPGGGATPYTYLWSTGATTSSISGLTAGVYTVSIHDANNCSATASISITQPATLTASGSTSTNVSCNGNSNGSGSVSASNGTSPYTYAWSNGATTSSISGLTAGVYTVSIHDANNCSATASISITQPNTLTASGSTSTNVSCNGNSNGSGSVSASNGTSPYTYLWSNGATTSSISGLTSGTYTVNVTDANNCSATASISITQPSTLTASGSTSTNVSCNGNSNGSGSVSANNGTSPYTYAWSNGATTSSISGLTAGVYTISIHDANNCSATSSISISQPATLTASGSTSTNVSCNGNSNGSGSVSASNGTSPYTYAWSNGATNSSISGLTAGVYTVSIHDANNCSATASISITQPNTLTASGSTSTNVSCNGNSNGSGSVSASNGTSPYTYAWSNGATTSSISGLTAGTYMVLVTDANGCNATASISITQPNTLSASGSTSTNVSCNGNTNGSGSVSANNGTSPYTYAWSNGATISSISGLTAGTYTVLVTDANNCSATASMTITQPNTLTASGSTSTNVSCNGNSNGSGSVSANNGTSPYTYAWSNGATTSSISGLTAGVYTISIHDANNCSATSSISISQPATLTASGSTSTNVSCNGNSNGSGSVSASNGTSPYTYAWSNGATNSSISGLTAGVYTVSIHDANNCSATASISITQPNTLTASGSTSTNVSCNGNSNGSGSVSASNGTSPYTYAWSNGATTSSISGLTAGVYTVSIHDANNCSATASISITQPNTLTASGSTSTNVSCNGNSDGSGSISASNGTSPYSYAWSNGATTSSISGLTAGTYTVLVTDANNCSATASMTITQPNTLTASGSTSTNVSCNGNSDGSGSVSASNGTSPYTYAWSNGATTSSISGLTAGVYTVSIHDANNCSATASISITQPNTLTASGSTSTNVSCNGNSNGSGSVSASNGTSPYTYAWSNGATNSSISNLSAGTYSVNVSDANNCSATASISITQPATLTASGSTSTNVSCNGNSDGSGSVSANNGTSPYTYAWSNGATTSSISNLSAGTYSVNVSDANNCSATASINITQPNTLTASGSTSTNVSCNGNSNGSGSVSASNGTSPYTYAWSNGATNSSISNLSAGTYSVNVSDANNCSATASISITQPATLTASGSTSTNVSCNGNSDGSGSVSANNGTSPYTYAWSNGATTSSISNLSAGTYSVNVSDANNCAATASITITQPAALTASGSTSTNVSCNGNSNGSGSVSASNGTSPYTYAWSNGATTSSISNLSAGTYSVNVSDANNCSATASISITQPATLTASGSTSTNVSCNGNSDGSGSVSANNGTSPYTYEWSNGATTSSISNLSAGTYTVNVTDANGCSATAGVSITQPDVLNGHLSITSEVLCYGDNSGSATSATTGGTSPYTYLWSNGATTSSISGLSAGSYALTVTDINHCTYMYSEVVVQPTQLRDSMRSTTTYNISCNGGSNGGAKVGVKGGVPPYTYSWAPVGGTNANISSLSAGTYSVFVTDGNGCSASASITLTQPALIRDSLASSVSPTCSGGGNNGTATIGVKGGTTPYTYVWTPRGGNLATGTGLYAGSYTVQITDQNRCVSNFSFSLTQSSSIRDSIAVGSVVEVLCYGNSGGSAAVGVKNGVSPYTYLWSPGGGTNQTESNLSAGSYTVNITDANGCTGSTSVTIVQPASAIRDSMISANITNVSCNGGSNGGAKVGVKGGKQPYTYSWAPVSATTASISGLSAGTYTVFATDVNGCSTSASLTLTQPAMIRDSLTSSVSPVCNGGNNGSASIGVKGGTSPYTFLWTPSGGTLATATGLSAGSYTVEIKDQYKCIENFIFSLTQPLALRDSIVAATKVNVLCGGSSTGSATVGTKLGLSPYTYLWSPGGGTNQTKTGLSAGTYTVHITDANGCTGSVSTTITQPGIIRDSMISADIVNIECNGSSTGSATVGIKNGTAPYTYVWSPLSGSKSKLTGMSAGITYTVNITDKNGCTASSTVSLTQPAAIRDSVATMTGPTCNAGDNGTATIGVKGGTTPYTYLWNPSVSTTKTATNLKAQSYTVNVKDKNGCSLAVIFTVTQPLAIRDSIVAATKVNVLCEGNNTGSATVGAKLGVAPYTYLWSPGGGTKATESTLSAGTYTVTVTDRKGCTSTTSTAITQPALLRDSIVTQSCIGSNGSATIGVKGGKTPYTYSWSPGGGTKATMTGLSNGSYTITITDKNGCTQTDGVSFLCASAPPNGDGPVMPDTCCPGGLGTQNINLYPNPNNGEFRIEGVQPGQIVQMYDYTGRLVKTETAGNSTIILNISNEANGVYMVRVLSKTGALVAQKKVVKMQ